MSVRAREPRENAGPLFICRSSNVVTSPWRACIKRRLALSTSRSFFRIVGCAARPFLATLRFMSDARLAADRRRLKRALTLLLPASCLTVREAIRLFRFAMSALRLTLPAALPSTIMHFRDNRRRLYVQLAAPSLQPIFDFSAPFFLVEIPHVVRLIGTNEICRYAGPFPDNV
jgi:hypothetical protein